MLTFRPDVDNVFLHNHTLWLFLIYVVELLFKLKTILVGACGIANLFL